MQIYQACKELGKMNCYLFTTYSLTEGKTHLA